MSAEKEDARSTKTGACRNNAAAHLTEAEALDAFAHALYERFGWAEYPLLLHWSKVLNLIPLRERLLDFAFSAPPSIGDVGASDDP